MRLRLSDATTSAVLAEHYRAQAEMCHQMARMTVSPFKEGWLEFAEEWTKLTREQEEKAKPAESEMPAGGSFSEASPENAPVDSPAPARGIGLLLPPSEPDAPAMDDSDREKNCASNQEAPELFVKASVEVLAPARQAQQSGKKSR